MTLSDILGRDLRVEWHEAVALVRDVVERIPEKGETAVPELHQVELLPWGQVELHGGARVSDPVQRLSQMLQALLGRADPPVQLRLLIAQPQESVRAFAEALAFFERPDRAAILQDLYNRATAALPLTDPELLAASSSSMSSPVAPDKGEPHAEPQRRNLVYAAGILILVLALGAGVLYARRSEGASSADAASDLTTRVSEKVSDVTAAVGSAVSAIGARVGLSGGTDVPAAPVEAPKTPEPTTRASRSKAPPKSDVPALQRAALSAFDLESSRNAPVVEKESVTVVAQPVKVPGAPFGADSVDATLYSSSSTGVSAPVGLRPQLPKELPAGVRAEDLTQIELVILPDGTVESVKLLGRARDIHAWMLLSAAKAWQFHPAMKDGFPVRYRKTVWVAH